MVAELEVAHGELSGLVRARARVVEKQEDGVVSATLWRTPVGRSQQGVDLRLLEIRSPVPVRISGRRCRRCGPTTRCAPDCVGRRTGQRHEWRPSVDCRLLGSSFSGDGDCVKKLPYPIGTEVLDLESVDRHAGVVTGERRQQSQGIAVAALRVAREVAFVHEVLQQEAADPWAESGWWNYASLSSRPA